MICKCGNTGIYNEVNHKSFYYCRSCKIEIELEEVYPGLDLPVWPYFSLHHWGEEMTVTPAVCTELPLDQE